MLNKYFPNLSEKQKNQFSILHDLFLDWNNKINLISRKNTEHFVEQHIIHSLSIAKFIQFKDNTSIFDVGTGGGMPGIPLAILFPNCKFKLVDSIGKKIMVVDDLVQKLELENVTTKHERVENIDQSFDFVVSRAVAPIQKIDSWVTHKIKKESINDIKNGYILLKGGDLTEEIAESKLSVSQTPISNYFSEEFFETKKIIYIQK